MPASSKTLHKTQSLKTRNGLGLGLIRTLIALTTDTAISKPITRFGKKLRDDKASLLIHITHPEGTVAIALHRNGPGKYLGNYSRTHATFQWSLEQQPVGRPTTRNSSYRAIAAQMAKGHIRLRLCERWEEPVYLSLRKNGSGVFSDNNTPVQVSWYSQIN